ncbi:MAG: radical SAM protein [Oligoflexia bacterium]|nr:radical SAM protein [Oligoflexia bacterium]
MKKKSIQKPAPARKTRPARAAKAEAPATPLIAGPLHTRRLGSALIVHLGTRPDKHCTWNCIYCQWKNAPKSTHERRQPVPDKDEILAQLADLLAKPRKPVDAIVLGGSSEPTVHPQFAELVEGLLQLRKKLGGKWLLHCISNGSALDREKVRRACDSIDRMWVKVDCATNELFRKANLPAARPISLEKHLNQIEKLKSPLIQTTFWRNAKDSELQNWSPENLLGLLNIYERLKPACVHLTTLRPSSMFSKLRPIHYENLEAFAQRVSDLGIDVEVFP